jgi:hypothetical protein
VVQAGILRAHGIVRVLMLALQFVELLALLNGLAARRQEFLQMVAIAGERTSLYFLFIIFLLLCTLNFVLSHSEDWMNSRTKWSSPGDYFAEMASAGWCTLPRMFRGTRVNRA